MKRIVTLTLAFLLCVGLLPWSAAASGELPFIDVSPEAWYYNDVKTAVDAGLVNGKSATTYCPDDLLTYAEAVKLAACMHQKNETGTVSLVNGDPWYQSYADYAKMKGIIAKDYDWTAKATRAGYMAIFAHALPDASLAAKNEVPDGSIPDVPASYPEAPEIYKLYRAGILQGSDDTYTGAWTKHLCKPADNIKRSEVAAILTRMMFVDKRISFSMAAETPADALKITKQPADVSAKVGANEKASFTVAVSGGKSPCTYQWYTKYTNTDEIRLKDNELNSGTTTATLTLTNIRAMDDGSLYWCVVTDAAGAKVTSSSAKLTIPADGLKIVKSPQNYTLKKVDETVSFTVEITGGKSPYIYKWWIEKETGSNFQQVDSEKQTTTYNVPFTKDSFTFTKYVRVYVEVTDADGAKVTSEKAEVTPFVENVPELKITKQPVDYTMTSASDKPVFSVTVSGGKAPYKYDWYVATEQFGGLSASHTKTETADQYVEDDPYYFAENETIRVWCRITDADGTKIDSDEVYLYRYYDNSLKITKQPQSITVAENSIVSFSIEVTGGKAPYTYDWQGTHTSPAYSDYNEWGSFHSGINGKSTVSFEADWYSFADKDQIYRCVVTDANGTKVISDTFEIYKSVSGLKITNGPYGSYSAKEGYIFEVDVGTVSGGRAPYKYDWQMRADPNEGYTDTSWRSFASEYNGKPTLSFEVEWYDFEYYFKCVVTDADGKKVETEVFFLSKTGGKG